MLLLVGVLSFSGRFCVGLVSMVSFCSIPGESRLLVSVLVMSVSVVSVQWVLFQIFC